MEQFETRAGAAAEFFEKTLSSRPIYDGKIISVRCDEVELPGGHHTTREVVSHIGGVGIVALDEQDNVLLVRQYRYPIGRELIEIPAGTLTKGEDPMECGIRELQEECGCTADRFEKLTELYPTPGYCGEIIRLYFCRVKECGAAHPDDDEFLEVERIPLDRAVEMVLNNEIPDAKTQVLILKIARLVEKA